MEDIPRDVHKELESYKVSKSTREKRHWTLLFIGERGEVITIRKFRGLMLLAFFIMVVSISAAASIFMLYQKPFEENQQLTAALVKVEKKVRALGAEKELLLTRLGIAESRLNKDQGSDPNSGQAEADFMEESLPANPELSPGGGLEFQQEQQPTRIEPAHSGSPELPKPAESEGKVPPEIKVDIQDLQVIHEPGQNLLNVQFKVINVNPEIGAISGRTFVLLETDSINGSEMLIYPKVPLVEGKPSRIRLGRYFSISRFNIVKFKSIYGQDPRPFSKATVFVYSGAGDLLLEKKFSIENPFKIS